MLIVIASLSIAAAIVAAVISPPKEVEAPAIVIALFASLAFAIEPASIAFVIQLAFTLMVLAAAPVNVVPEYNSSELSSTDSAFKLLP